MIASAYFPKLLLLTTTMAITAATIPHSLAKLLASAIQMIPGQKTNAVSLTSLTLALTLAA
jgi:hypothetical protein